LEEANTGKAFADGLVGSLTKKLSEETDQVRKLTERLVIANDVKMRDDSTLSSVRSQLQDAWNKNQDLIWKLRSIRNFIGDIQ